MIINVKIVDISTLANNYNIWGIFKQKKIFIFSITVLREIGLSYSTEHLIYHAHEY